MQMHQVHQVRYCDPCNFTRNGSSKIPQWQGGITVPAAYLADSTSTVTEYGAKR